jgi:hypothetical protein
VENINDQDNNGRWHDASGKYCTAPAKSQPKTRGKDNVPQSGGFLPALAPLITTGITLGQKYKPATKIQEGLKNTNFGKTTPGKVITDLLEIPKLFGFGEEQVRGQGKAKTPKPYNNVVLVVQPNVKNIPKRANNVPVKITSGRGTAPKNIISGGARRKKIQL